MEAMHSTKTCQRGGRMSPETHPDGKIFAQEIPMDIIADIISELLIKSILRCKSVSKVWYCLIRSDHFIKKHLLRSNSTDEDDDYNNIMVAAVDRYTGIVLGSLPSLSYDTCIFKYEYPISPRPSFRSPRLLGSCNGLLCVLVTPSPCNYCIFIANPATKENKILPKSFLLVDNLDSRCGTSSFGFGYDSSTDDYKVVKINARSLTRVYSLRADSWRMMEKFPSDDGLLTGEENMSGVFVNGALHWTVFDIENQRWNVITFNLITNTYSKILLPNFVYSRFAPCLTVSGGFLCIEKQEDVESEIWGMKCYGKQDSWTKLDVRRHFKVYNSSIRYTKSLSLLTTGDVWSRFQLYDTFDPCPVYSKCLCIRLEGNVVFYRESVVSPNAICGTVKSRGESLYGKVRYTKYNMECNV